MHKKHSAILSADFTDSAYYVWLNGSVVSRLAHLEFELGVVPIFCWVATFDKLFTHIAPPVSQLQKLGYKKGVFGA